MYLCKAIAAGELTKEDDKRKAEENEEGFQNAAARGDVRYIVTVFGPVNRPVNPRLDPKTCELANFLIK